MRDNISDKVVQLFKLFAPQCCKPATTWLKLLRAKSHGKINLQIQSTMPQFRARNSSNFCCGYVYFSWIIVALKKPGGDKVEECFSELMWVKSGRKIKMEDEKMIVGTEACVGFKLWLLLGTLGLEAEPLLVTRSRDKYFITTQT